MISLLLWGFTVVRMKCFNSCHGFSIGLQSGLSGECYCSSGICVSLWTHDMKCCPAVGYLVSVPEDMERGATEVLLGRQRCSLICWGDRCWWHLFLRCLPTPLLCRDALPVPSVLDFFDFPVQKGAMIFNWFIDSSVHTMFSNFLCRIMCAHFILFSFFLGPDNLAVSAAVESPFKNSLWLNDSTTSCPAAVMISTNWVAVQLHNLLFAICW